MRRAIEVLKQLHAEGVLADFAVGGVVAASFYTPAVKHANG